LSLNLLLESRKKEEALTTEIIVQGTGDYVYKNGSLLITEAVFDSTEKPNANLIFLPLEYGAKKLSIRVWKSGDSIRPFGMKGRQKVSDILIQKKVPMPEKSNITVLECEGEILWVMGLRASEFTRVCESEHKTLKLLITT
jgi:tRNA(Ile)-lysidine synthetase-like protein